MDIYVCIYISFKIYIYNIYNNNYIYSWLNIMAPEKISPICKEELWANKPANT